MVGGETKQVSCNEHVGRNLYRKKDLRKVNLNINSIRGQLRWWFRTIHGYSDNLSKLENDFFGSTSNSSATKLGLKNPNLNLKEWQDNLNVKIYGTYPISGNHRGQYNGLKYFSYTNKVPAPNYTHPENNLITIREYAEPGGTFDVFLMAAPNDRIKLLALFWIAVQFSGFGNRSRRCFGNVNITNPKRLNYEPGVSFTTFSSYSSQEHYETIIRQNFKTLKAKIFPAAFEGTNAMPAITDQARLFLSAPIEEPGWNEAINFAGVTMQRYRAVDKFEHDTLATYDSTPAELRRPIFGMPIVLRYSSTHTKLAVNYKPDRMQAATRLASPILVSLTQIANKFHVQYLILDYHLNSDKIIAQYGRDARPIKVVADAKKQFIRHLVDGFSFPDSDKVYKYQEINLWS